MQENDIFNISFFASDFRAKASKCGGSPSAGGGTTSARGGSASASPAKT